MKKIIIFFIFMLFLSSNFSILGNNISTNKHICNRIDSEELTIFNDIYNTRNDDVISSIRNFDNKLKYREISNKKVNFYNGNKIPTYLQPGDMIFCDIKPNIAKIINIFVDGFFNERVLDGFCNDHVAMYIGKNKIIHSMPTGGVKIITFKMLKTWAKNIAFVSIINTTESQRQDAINWAKDRLFSPYQHNPMWPSNLNPNDKEDKYSDCWTCAELIWAAYKNIGVNITNIFYDKNQYPNFFITTDYLLFADNVFQYQVVPLRLIYGHQSNFLNNSPRLVYFYGFYVFDRSFQSLRRWDFNNDGNWTNWTYNHFIYHEYENLGNYSVRFQIKDNKDNIIEQIQKINLIENNPPEEITNISGSSNIYEREYYNYNFSTTDPDGDDLLYFVYWGDGTSNQYGPIKSNETVHAKKKWELTGNFTVNIYAMDENKDHRFNYTIFNVTVNKNNKPKSFIEKFLEKHIRLEMIIKNYL